MSYCEERPPPADPAVSPELKRPRDDELDLYGTYMAKINPEAPDRDRTYLERILKMLDAGELKD